MDLCGEQEIIVGVQVGIQWCEKAGIYLVGDRDRAVVAEDADKDGRGN